MGTNAAFGRPPAHERLRDWWYAKSRTTRSNIVITLVVGAVVVALVRAATSGDAARSGSRVNASRPTMTVVTPTSTTLVGSLFAASDAFGLSSTTSSTTSVAPPVTAAPSARTAAPSTSPPPATTVPTQDVIYTEVPAPVTTVPASTAPPTTATPTTPPPTTVPRAASTPTTVALLGLPPLIGTG